MELLLHTPTWERGEGDYMSGDGEVEGERAQHEELKTRISGPFAHSLSLSLPSPIAADLTRVCVHACPSPYAVLWTPCHALSSLPLRSSLTGPCESCSWESLARVRDRPQDMRSLALVSSPRRSLNVYSETTSERRHGPFLLS